MTRRLALAIVAMGAAQVAVYMVRPLTSYRLLGLGAGGAAVGLVAAAFALLPLFLAIPLGRYADRSHGLRLVPVGCAVQAVGCLLLAAGRSPLALGAASAVLGIGHLGVALGAQAVVARESSEERQDEHFALLTVGVSTGQLLGPLLAGLLVVDRGSASLVSSTGRAMLVAAAVAVVATACGVISARSGEATPPVASQRAGSVRAIMATRGVPAGIFASIAVLSAADVFTAYMPVLGQQRGIAPAVVGALLAVRAAASIGARLGISTLVRTVGRVRLMVVNALLAATALAAITQASDLAVLFVLSALVGAGLGFGQPLSMTLVVQLVPVYARGTALAVRLTGNRLGQVAAPAVAGAVAGSAGTTPVFWMLSSMLAASAVAVNRLGNGAPEQPLADSR